MKTSQLIKRTYRITPLQDKIIKRTAKKDKVSESEIIRTLIDKLSK